MAWVSVRVCLRESACGRIVFRNPCTNVIVLHSVLGAGTFTVMVPPGLDMHITGVPLALFRALNIDATDWLPYLRSRVSARVYATSDGVRQHAVHVGNIGHGEFGARLGGMPAEPPVRLWMTCFTAVPTTTTPLRFHSQVIDWVVAYNSWAANLGLPVAFSGYMVTFVIGSDGMPRPSQADMVTIAQYADTASAKSLQLGAVNGGYGVPWSAACSTSPTATISCSAQFLGAVNALLGAANATQFTLLGADYEDNFAAYGVPQDPSPEVMSTLIRDEILTPDLFLNTGITTFAVAGGVAYNGTNLTVAGTGAGVTVMGMPEMYGLTDGDTCQYANTLAGILGNWFPSPDYPTCVGAGVCATRGCVSNATLLHTLLAPSTAAAATLPLFSLEQLPAAPCYSSVFSDSCAASLHCCFAEADFGSWTVLAFTQFLLQYAAKIQLGRVQLGTGLSGPLTLGVFEVGQLPLAWFTALGLPAPTRSA